MPHLWHLSFLLYVQCSLAWPAATNVNACMLANSTEYVFACTLAYFGAGVLRRECIQYPYKHKYHMHVVSVRYQCICYQIQTIAKFYYSKITFGLREFSTGSVCRRQQQQHAGKYRRIAVGQTSMASSHHADTFQRRLAADALHRQIRWIIIYIRSTNTCVRVCIVCRLQRHTRTKFASHIRVICTLNHLLVGFWFPWIVRFYTMFTCTMYIITYHIHWAQFFRLFYIEKVVV